MRIPWGQWGVAAPLVDSVWGFDIANNDRAGGVWESQETWNAPFINVPSGCRVARFAGSDATTCRPPVEEVCDDGIDANDCDKLVDGARIRGLPTTARCL
ncbi:MAG: hypothetical protein R3C68_09035 [Myxococcota bacterium]